jgi:uncharacterized membrane protein YeaQ/YmgE (transglycosylase-associated protein family)
MGIGSWILLGLVAGVLAKWLMPGEVRGGIVLTILLGIGGALLGGFIASHLLEWGDISGFDWRSLGLAVGGAVLLLVIHGWMVKAKLV